MAAVPGAEHADARSVLADAAETVQGALPDGVGGSRAGPRGAGVGHGGYPTSVGGRPQGFIKRVGWVRVQAQGAGGRVKFGRENRDPRRGG